MDFNMDIFINFSSYFFSNSSRDLIKNVFTNFVLVGFAGISIFTSLEITPSILEEFLKKLFRISSRVFPQKFIRYYLKKNPKNSPEISSGIPSETSADIALENRSETIPRISSKKFSKSSTWIHPRFITVFLPEFFQDFFLVFH